MREPAMNVGCRALVVADVVQGASVPVHVLYPTQAAARPASFGPYSLELAFDAPVAGERLRVVAISHGTGGTPWVHRALATFLARAGLGVVLVEHPGNSRNDNSLADTPANLANRPRHVRLALDAALADAHVGPHLDVTELALVGHSLGGYTALAVAGGRPLALPDQTADGKAHPVPVEPDARVRAVVLLAPALPWLIAPGALDDVRARLFVRTGEHDDQVPPAFVESILRGLPDGTDLDYAVVPGAGHFAFVTPFPPAMVRPGFPPSQDPPGFDRVVYQRRLCAEVQAFVQRR